jgi:hypothetical protein
LSIYAFYYSEIMLLFENDNLPLLQTRKSPHA